MSVRDYVHYGIKKDENGVDGYFLASTPLPQKSLHSKIWPGKKTNYIDDFIKMKKHVPPAYYNIMGDMNIKGHKSSVAKDIRRTLPVEIDNYQKKNNFPAPSHYKPSDKLTAENHKACLSFKDERKGFLDEALFKGSYSPIYHNLKHDIVEKRIQAPKYRAPGKHDLAGPAFLR